MLKKIILVLTGLLKMTNKTNIKELIKTNIKESNFSQDNGIL